MEIIRLLEILKRRWLTALVSFGLFYGAVIVGTLLAKPYFKATAKVLSNKSTTLPRSFLSNIGIGGQAVPLGNASDSDSTVYDTDTEMVKLRPILEQTIQDLQLRQRSGQTIRYDQLVKNYFLKIVLPEPHLKVDQLQDSSLLEIRGYSGDADEAAAIANTVADLYIKDQIRITQEEYAAARQFLQTKIKEVQEKLHAAVVVLRDHRVENGYVSLTEETTVLLTKVQVLRTEYEDSQSELIGSKRRLEVMRQEIVKTPEFREDSFTFAMNDQLSMLRSKLTEARIEEAGTATDITREHPGFRELEKRLETIQALLNEEKQRELQLVGKTERVQPVYDQLLQDIVTATVQVEGLTVMLGVQSKLLDAYQEKLMRLPFLYVGEMELNTETQALQTSYASLISYLSRLEIAETMSLSGVKLVDSAVRPATPSWPKRLVNLIAGVFLGACVSLVVALFLDVIDPSLKSPEDVLQLENWWPVWCTIPRLGLKARSPGTEAGSLSSLASLKAIRSCLDRPPFSGGKGGIKLVVTSPCRGDGKTTVASGLASFLAREFSQQGKRKALLIDLNLQRPRIRSVFKAFEKKGPTHLSEISRGIVPTQDDHLDILPMELPAREAEFIDSSEWGALLQAFGDSYDAVVVDTAPLMDSVDAAILGRFADAVVLVVRYRKTPISMMVQIKSMMERSQTSISGIVVNRFPGKGLLHWTSPPDDLSS